MSDHPIHNTDGVSAKMVDSIGDDEVQGPSVPPQAFAAPSSGDPYATLPYEEPHDHKKGACESCKKELGVMRAALIILAVIIGALAMVYLAQRRGHTHGGSDENASAPSTDD